MTETYKESDPIEFKIKEELRCIRCASERLLRLIAPQEFVDYQMEKFGKKYKQEKR